MARPSRASAGSVISRRAGDRVGGAPSRRRGGYEAGQSNTELAFSVVVSASVGAGCREAGAGNGEQPFIAGAEPLVEGEAMNLKTKRLVQVQKLRR